MVATVAASAQKDSLKSVREYINDVFVPAMEAFHGKTRMAIDLFGYGYYESGVKTCYMAIRDSEDPEVVKECRILLRSIHDWDRKRFHEFVESNDIYSDIDWKLYIPSYNYSDWK